VHLQQSNYYQNKKEHASKVRQATQSEDTAVAILATFGVRIMEEVVWFWMVRGQIGTPRSGVRGQ
jgi:hypothetical protein